MLSSHDIASSPFDDETSDTGLTPVVQSFRGMLSQASAQAPLEALERYKLVARLGQGGMAEVFLAAWEVAPFEHRAVVIKRLHPHLDQDAALVQMFLDEARLISQLDHPNVVKTLEAGRMDGRCCIAMEYLEGQPLQRVLRRAHQQDLLTPQVAVSIAISMLDGLHYSHEATDEQGHALEIVHRDVSPQNVFITNDGQVKVLDFGIAKAKTHEGRTATGMIKGKVAYIAPEQATGALVDRRADVWSTGVVLWEALTGARLFKAETEAETLGRCLQGEIPRARSLAPNLPPELDEILARALQRDSNARYQTAGSMQKALESWLARAGFSRDARVIAALMKRLFASEMLEQSRVVSVLMARSDCMPPSASGEFGTSSTSALVSTNPTSAAAEDLTRMQQQVKELGHRHRRAVRVILALMMLLSGIVWGVGYCVFKKLDPAGPSRMLAAPSQHPQGHLDSKAAARTEPAAPLVSAIAAKAPAPSEPLAVQWRQGRRLARGVQSSNVPSPPPATLAPANREASVTYGLLTLDTSPWSFVSIAGRPLGQTPLINVKLATGSQVLTLKNPEQGLETSYAVTIEEGKTTVRRLGIE